MKSLSNRFGPAACAVAAWLCIGVAPAAAQSAETLQTRSLVATCAACHGTDGRAVAGSGMVALAGMQKAQVVDQMRAFRDGSRPATVMHQIAKGYSEAQIDAIAGALAAGGKP